jgi:hypothetical protein
MKMKLIIKITLILFIVSGAVYAEEDYPEKPTIEDGYYRVVESVLQIPTLSFKEFFNEICYVVISDRSSNYTISPLEGSRKIIYFSDNGRIYYQGYYFISNQITSHSRFDFYADFDSKKGNDLYFYQKNLFQGDVTRKVVLTYLGKDLKQAVKKLK